MTGILAPAAACTAVIVGSLDSIAIGVLVVAGVPTIFVAISAIGIVTATPQTMQKSQMQI